MILAILPVTANHIMKKPEKFSSKPTKRTNHVGVTSAISPAGIPTFAPRSLKNPMRFKVD